MVVGVEVVGTMHQLGVCIIISKGLLPYRLHEYIIGLAAVRFGRLDGVGLFSLDRAVAVTAIMAISWQRIGLYVYVWLRASFRVVLVS